MTVNYMSYSIILMDVDMKDNQYAKISREKFS